jgi:hypothetical protein
MNKPSGLNHQEREFAMIKLPHFIILKIQEAYPELEKEMRLNPSQATNILSSFLSIVPLKVKKQLPSNLESDILKTYKVIK